MDGLMCCLVGEIVKSGKSRLKTKENKRLNQHQSYGPGTLQVLEGWFSTGHDHKHKHRDKQMETLAT